MRPVFALLSLIIMLEGFAQVSGRVVDSQDGMPLVGAAIQVYGRDSLLLSKIATGADGDFFSSENPQRVSTLKVTYLGYDSTVVHTAGRSDIGVIKLSPSSVVLSSVTVTADAHPQNAYSETFLISDSIRSSANSAAMMIGNLPGFKVDWISENISIGSDQNVPIIVNGREMGFQYAKSINPKRIKTIQVQRFPPGQYSDYPILINIELFDNYVGWDVSGNAVGMLSLRNRHSNSEAVSVDGTLSATGWNTYMSAAYKRKQGYEASSYIRDIAGKYVEETSPIDRENPNIGIHADEYSLSVGADRRFGDRHLLSLQTWGDFIDNEGEDYYDMTDGTHLINRDNYKSINSITGLFYRGRLADRVQIRSTLIYNYYNIDETRTFIDAADISQSDIDGHKHYLFFSGDGIFSISDKWEATLGYNYTWRKYNSTDNANPAEQFLSKENRNKLDATVSFSPSRTFNIRAGGSMLNISNRQNDITSNHTSWLPRVQLYWRPLTWATVNAVYLNDIYYPNLDQLSTSSWQISSHLIQTGNPDLRSKIMHYVNARLTILDWLTLQYMWRRSNNDIVEWYEPISPEVVRKTFVNCDYLHQYAGLSVDKNLGKGFNLNFVGNYQWYKRWTAGTENNGRTWYGDITATWAIGKTDLTLLCEYFIRHDMEPLPQGKRYNQQENLVVGFNYPFCKGRLSLSGLLSIPVNAIDKRTYTKIDIPGFKYETYGDDRINSFVAKINLRYNFGRGKAKRSSNAYITDTEK